MVYFDLTGVHFGKPPKNVAPFSKERLAELIKNAESIKSTNKLMLNTMKTVLYYC